MKAKKNIDYCAGAPPRAGYEPGKGKSVYPTFARTAYRAGSSNHTKQLDSRAAYQKATRGEDLAEFSAALIRRKYETQGDGSLSKLIESNKSFCLRCGNLVRLGAACDNCRF